MENQSQLTTSVFNSYSSFHSFIAHMPIIVRFKNKDYFLEKRDYRLPQIEVDMESPFQTNSLYEKNFWNSDIVKKVFNLSKDEYICTKII